MLIKATFNDASDADVSVGDVIRGAQNLVGVSITEPSSLSGDAHVSSGVPTNGM